MSKISELSDGGALQSTDYLIAVRSGGNVKVQPAGMTFSSVTITSSDINGGTIDGTVIGGASAAAGTFTNLTATGTTTITTADINGGTIDGATLGGSSQVTITDADMNGGTIDGVVIGGASAAAGTFTNLTASGTVSFSGATVSNGGTVTTVNIDGGSIDGTVIGGATPAAGSFTTGQFGTSLNVDGPVTADDVSAAIGTFSQLNVGANLAWNSSTDTYTTNTTPSTVTNVHRGMKRCVLNDDGTVNYYLDPDDSTLKEDGTSANIDGTDGNVMVEIPKFYFRQNKVGNVTTWEVSDVQLAGYVLHPAFLKNGAEVDHRYIGAYDACYLDATDSTYKSGLNLDDMTSNLDLANDKLASVSGVYPLVGVTRAECRSLADNVGTGWRVQDFWLTCAVQMLYLVEYGTFYSQDELGAGNTNGSYVSSSSSQSDSPHTIAGASNAWGNASTDGTQPSAGAKPGTAYMSYRGIENFFGNCWNWVDGFNIGISVDRDAWVSNTDTDFADDTSTNYDDLGITMASANGYVQNIADVDGAFLPTDTTGASSSTYLTDQFFQATGNRVAFFGGAALNGASAGAFCWVVVDSSSSAGRDIGARLAY